MSRIRPTTVAMFAARHDEAGNASRSPVETQARSGADRRPHPSGSRRRAGRAAGYADPSGPSGLTLSRRYARWCRPSGTTSGVAVTGSLAMTDSTPNTSRTSPAVTTSDGSPAATMEPSRIATRWSA